MLMFIRKPVDFFPICKIEVAFFFMLANEKEVRFLKKMNKYATA